MSNIPASQLVQVIPSVLTPGGSPNGMYGVIVTEDGSPPIGSPLYFANAAAVGAWFGLGSNQYALASIYFNGFNGATQLPGQLLFYQYNASAVAAYLRGASLASLTLTQLQALTGTITVAVNGETVTSAAISLSGASSFSAAAALIQTGLQTSGNVFSGTASLSGTTMTVVSTVSGQLYVGAAVAGTGLSGQTILSFGTYTVLSGVGTVTLSSAATTESTEAVTVTLLPTVSYDSLRQAFVITSPTTGASSTIAFPTDSSLSPALSLTSATGAYLSQGAAAATPAGTMSALAASTQNWASFMTDWLPISSVMLGFAAWVTAQQEQYVYVPYDNNMAAVTGAAPTCFAELVNSDNGIFPIWNPDGTKAAFVCGAIASINFSATNGRINFAYKGQAGLVPDVTNGNYAQQLLANKYNFYGSYATATTQFQFLQNGQMSGPWTWLDPYVNQIYWNAAFQLALLDLLSEVRSIPYNSYGYNLIRTALGSVIAAMGNFGAWQAGVVLSGSQIAAVNAAAGLQIATTLQNTGNYLQVKDPGPTVRGNRGTPIINFWFTDGSSVNLITMASIDVE
jgi:hypothetical protein